MVVDGSHCRSHLYKSLPAFTNLYRSAAGSMVESFWKQKDSRAIKHPLVWAGAFLITIGIIAISVRADAPWSRGWRRNPAMGCIAGRLNLTCAQKAQIQSIWNMEKPTAAKLVADSALENKEIESVTSQGHPDPDKIQAMADHQGKILSELLLEKEILKMQIESRVLTADQLAKADHFEKHVDDRIDAIAHRLSQ
jgi:hypothetical protein